LERNELKERFKTLKENEIVLCSLGEFRLVYAFIGPNIAYKLFGEPRKYEDALNAFYEISKIKGN